ncbi:MAG: hypothetical protein IKM64_03460 [Clostridia bacterium]|nr:hypothetical protein [Clostridia bacterium]
MAQKAWFKLDNAAKLYPAISTNRWMSTFRMSAQLHESIQPDVLQKALDDTLPRFPSLNVRLRAGIFWYYLEQAPGTLQVRQDEGHPCMPFSKKRDGSFLLRVFYFRNRISAEFFHVLTDGTGGLCFLKTLTVRYLQLLGHDVCADQGALDVADAPKEEETLDAFHNIPLPDVRLSRKEEDAWHFPGTKEISHTLNVIAASMPAAPLLEKAHEMNVTFTEYMVSLMLLVAYESQKESGKRPRPIRVSVPVNMRSFYGINTMRNFSSFLNPGIDPRLGEYSLEEICHCVHAFMAHYCTRKHLSGIIATNVAEEKPLLIRLAPLFIKNWAIASVFRNAGDRQFTSTFSNVGKTPFPTGSEKLIRRFEFLLGVPYDPLCNCACIACGDEVRITFSSNIRETTLPRKLLCRLVEMGIPVEVESNYQEES